MIDQVIDKCKQLRLKACGQNIAQVIETGSQKNWSAVKTFAHLFDLELEYRHQNRIALCLKNQNLPKNSPSISLTLTTTALEKSKNRKY